MSRLKSAATLASVAALAFCVVTPAFAQSLAQKQKYAEEEKGLSEYIKKTNEECKMNLDAKFDWSAIKYQELWPSGHTPSAVCGAAVAGIRDVCRVSGDAMKAVQSNVKGVICKEAPPGGFSFKNGILVYGMDLTNDANTADRTRKFLMDNL
ncbi:MAG: hypothetical protein FWD67_07775 [Betaproteobacteria bacterium]|nr:hypothetical protein [Betaproteobacteria bacterium]